VEPLLLSLVLAGLLVGATGTWSPCGFSMIETIGPTGHTGGMPTTLAACASFAPFAVLGGALTFGLLGAVGGLVGGGAFALGLGAAVALAAAVAEARGLPIVPQVRRQLPVGWRRSVPMPLAAAGYGVLLGLGFTTFVLSYGVWALMGIALAIGDPMAGLLLGVAFGIGRALPIVLLAPLADRPTGERACEAMAMRPGLYRGARVGDALALALVAVVLAGDAWAEAARKEVAGAADPSTAGPTLAYEPNSGGGELRLPDGSTRSLPGTDPAIGGPWVAVAGSGRVRVFERETMEPTGSVAARGVDGIAVSRGWLAYRMSRKGRDIVKVTALGRGGKPLRTRRLARSKHPAQLSRPAADRNLVLLAVANKRRSKLVRYRLRAGRRTAKRALIATPTATVAGPSIAGKRIAYVLTTRKRQTVRVKGLGKGKGRTVLRRRSGPPTLWTTAISGKRVFVTIVNRGGRSRIVSAGR
jgi:hypothetical protein